MSMLMQDEKIEGYFKECLSTLSSTRTTGSISRKPSIDLDNQDLQSVEYDLSTIMQIIRGKSLQEASVLIGDDLIRHLSNYYHAHHVVASVIARGDTVGGTNWEKTMNMHKRKLLILQAVFNNRLLGYSEEHNATRIVVEKYIYKSVLKKLKEIMA